MNNPWDSFHRKICTNEWIFKTKKFAHQAKYSTNIFILFHTVHFKFNWVFRRKMEAVCFLCQDFKANVGHETITCPKSECKNCGQHGHFRINCKFKSMITPWFKAKNAKRFIFTRFLTRKLHIVIWRYMLGKSKQLQICYIVEVPDSETIFWQFEQKSCFCIVMF